MNQVGKYTLKSYHVPKGYEVVAIFCAIIHWEDDAETQVFEQDGFTVTQKEVDAMSNSRFYGYLRGVTIYVRKIDSEATPVTFALPTASTVFVNGQAMAFDAYQINGNNYFKLRDIGNALNFSIEWNEEENAIVIDTDKEYSI